MLNHRAITSKTPIINQVINMINIAVVALVANGSKAGDISLSFSRTERPARLFVENNQNFLKPCYQGEDYFYALRNLRIDLEKEGYFLACKGNLTSVYPSGMSADMSNGLIAYQYENGELLKVNIFDDVPADQYSHLGSVENQKKLRRSLIKTRKLQRGK